MKLPVRFMVRLPDGSEHTVNVLHMRKDGTVTRIDTHGVDGSKPLESGWYTIESDELEQITLLTFYPPSLFGGEL